MLRQVMEAMELLVEKMRKTENNAEFLVSLGAKR